MRIEGRTLYAVEFDGLVNLLNLHSVFII